MHTEHALQQVKRIIAILIYLFKPFQNENNLSFQQTINVLKVLPISGLE